MNPKLANAKGLYLEGIRDGNFRHAISTYTGNRYTQHSTGIRDGREGFIEFFEGFVQRNTDRDIRIVRSIVDGQYVFVQAYQNLNNGEAIWVTTDLFDTDDNDKMIEHWDVISALHTHGDSEGTQLDGPTEIVDLPETENNKETVRNFLREVMVLGKAEQLQDYMDPDTLVLHKAPDVRSITEDVGSYNLVFKIIGQGNFVVSYSRVLLGENEFARFDIFRLKSGWIEEVWTNQEIVPPKEEWANGGKF